MTHSLGIDEQERHASVKNTLRVEAKSEAKTFENEAMTCALNLKRRQEPATNTLENGIPEIGD